MRGSPSSACGWQVHFRLEGDATRRDTGLRVISDIPNGRLQRLEGQNGIGKTLAVRLLELCTGRQPFLDRAASWATLRELLHQVTVTVEGLSTEDGHDAKTLTLELADSRDWPKEPEDVGEWLGHANLDGKSIPITSIRELLTVQRIGGDEALGESLAADLGRANERMRWLQRRQQMRHDAWGEHVAAVLRVTAAGTAFDLADLRETSATLQNEFGLFQSAATQAEQEAQNAAELGRLVQRAQDLLQTQPRIEAELAAAEAAERATVVALDGLDRQAAELLNKSHKAKEIRKRVDDLVPLQRKRQERRERRRLDLQAICRAADLSVPVDLIAADELGRNMREELEQLRQQRLSHDRAGLVLELVADVSRPVGRAVAGGLGDEVLAQLPAGPATVRDLEEGLERRRQGLQVGTSSAATKINDQISRLQGRLAAAARIADAVRLLGKAESDLTATRTEITEVLSELSRPEAQSYEQVNEQRAVLVDQLASYLQQKSTLEAELAELLSDGGEEELRQRVAAIGATLGLAVQYALKMSPEAADQRTRELAEVADDAHRRSVTAAQERDRAVQEVAAAESAVRAAIHQLRDDTLYGWLHQQVRIPPGDDSQILHNFLVRLHGAAQEVGDRLVESLNDVQAVEEAIDELQSRLNASARAGNIAGSRNLPLGAAVRRYYERQFADKLTADELRAALFDYGRDISVDLEEMTTSWTARNGTAQTRPLEAFSSGERAFAYTQVQLQQLAQGPQARNRVVFLDEFGAFVARERFDQLLRYLRHQALGSIADQVVLILPLRERLDEGQTAELKRRGGYVIKEVK